MISKLLVATALTLSLGGAAFAQSNTGSQTPSATDQAGQTGKPMGNVPTGWDGAIGDAFFSDMNAGTLRSQDEIATNWAALSAEQQAQVKLDCSSMAADSSGGSTDTTTTSSTATDTTTGTSAGGATDGASASQSDQMAAMSQLCDWVDSM